MKKLLLPFLILLTSIWMGCSDDSEDPAVDCSSSDLSISLDSQTAAGCTDPGSLTFSATGGTEPYTYSIDAVNFQNSPTFTGLAAGSYTAVVIDANNCDDQTSVQLAAGGDAIILSINSSESDCESNTGSLTVNASGGDGSYEYAIDGGAPQSSNSFNGLSSGSHTIIVTDGSGCSSTSEQIISTNTSWENDIMPIISSNCAVSGCHNGSNSSIPNWSVLSNVQASAGNIQSRTTARTMPPAGRSQLSDSDIALIACWVEDGAKNN